MSRFVLYEGVYIIHTYSQLPVWILFTLSAHLIFVFVASNMLKLMFCVSFFPVSSESLSSEQHLLSVPELSHHLAESYLTSCMYLQEMLQYKRQNHGKAREKKTHQT